MKADMTQKQNTLRPETLVEDLFFRYSGRKAVSIEPLPESGSYRRYYRIFDGTRTVMGVHNADARENLAFITLDRQLRLTGSRVPEVFAEDPENNVYLEEDLGDITLLDYLQHLPGLPGKEEKTLDVYRKVIDAMPALQVASTDGLDYSVCYPRAEFDVQSMMWDMNYFKYCLLKPLKIGFFEQDLEDDFNAIVGWLNKADRRSFMFRDFQSRNIMLHRDELYFIDFQGGRRGPLQYDLASLLYEAKTHLPEEIREALLGYYLDLFEKTFPWFHRQEFLEYYYGFVYLRMMQAMGAYGFRGYIERKPLFLQSLPYAVRTMAWLVKHKPLPLKLTALPGIFEKLASMRKIQEYEVVHDSFTIKVASFSYKNGPPQDATGNGGGFVFDCRCLTNPGRLEAYKELTGRDEAVVAFLEKDDLVAEFFLHARQLTEQAVEVYMDRGFTSLMVSFGCTGGQHRSVYMAERLAAALKNKYPVNVVIHHQEIEKNRPA
jgi:aminoglycoside/choline kinase family phosphotransferase